MGVAMAYPLDRYETLQTDISRLSDTRENGWPTPPADNDDERSLVTRTLSNAWRRGGRVVTTTFDAVIRGTVRRLFGFDKVPEKREIDHWDMAQNRHNVFLFARLRDKSTGADFAIGTYHMPCAFFAPMVMTIHAEMVVRRLRRLSNGAACVLAGDFNILPDSPTYRLITSGVLDRAVESEDYPSAKWGMEWVSGISGAEGWMRSAYAVKEGREPDFTNYAKIKEDDPFIGTLDYIFISDEWDVLEVDKIPHRNDVKGPLPNADEPSDHVLIAANLQITPNSQDVCLGDE
eukprot:CAMPEP_0172500430 /NCGR_PEP_ID=MMETSP1066-20121228/138109_1 /TAXON_ID=671091 /ORGANISM="Coscinodiscus wailesii, Strain CCMP2513" /LENGTH=289 /DNA_ID=CAMNT_0013274651 /DNA_START=477 /DNA_END=1346 /DNA_ORIENTATION=-